MNNMLYLHSPYDGSVILINANNIESVGKSSIGETIVTVHHFTKRYTYAVKEEPEEIYKLLEERS